MDVVVTRSSERMHFTLTPVLMQKEGVGYLAWVPETEVRISTLEKGMAADRAGLQLGDSLISANGIPLRSTVRLLEIEKDTDGKPLDIVYSRQGAQQHVMVTPEKRDLDGQGPHWVIGLKLEPRVEYTHLPMRDCFHRGDQPDR